MWDGVYAYGLPRPDSAPDPDMPRGWTNPREGNKHYAYIADIKTAWVKTDLSDAERRTLFLRFAFDLTEEAIGAYEGVSQPAISYRLYKGVGKLVAQLNGGEFVESYNEDEAA